MNKNPIGPIFSVALAATCVVLAILVVKTSIDRNWKPSTTRYEPNFTAEEIQGFTSAPSIPEFPPMTPVVSRPMGLTFGP